MLRIVVDSVHRRQFEVLPGVNKLGPWEKPFVGDRRVL